MEADYTYEVTRLPNAPARAECLLQSLEHAANAINLQGTQIKHTSITTLNDKPLNLVDHFL